MSKIKRFLPLIIALLIVIIGCIIFNNNVRYTNYTKDVNSCNSEIDTLKDNIAIYKKALENDIVDEDINYIFEDGETVAKLENNIIKEQKDNYSDVQNPGDLPQKVVYSKSQRQLMSMMKKEDEMERIFASAWILDPSGHVEFLSSFYSGRIEIPVVWEIYDGNNKLWGVAKANYNVDERTYSNLNFVVVDLISNSDSEYDENPFD